MNNRIEKIYQILNRLAPEQIVFLQADTTYKLLIGVILSAQTTDNQVNIVLPELFRHYPTPEALGRAFRPDVEEIIRSTGFYSVKAANIIATGKMLAEEFGSEVPGKMEELLKLPGVGRKTANVILGACFDKPAIIVDTHFSRTVRRLGFTDEKTPEKIESDLRGKIDPEIQYRFSMLFNKLGRDFCKSRKPECMNCPINEYCDSADKTAF